uniref:NADH dehydrogenase subunit 6 n=1 Tax=Struwela camposi TaxID=2859449 RepID=UPI0030FF3134
MLTLFLSLSISLMFMTPILNTPLFLGLSILLYSLAISTLTAMTCSSWFGLILFIIYIGGMLVMFAYFAALSPNQMYNLPSIPLMFLVSFIITFMYLTTLDTKYFMPSLLSSSIKMNTFLYSQEQAPILIFLVILLLLALILVVKMTKHTTGPLRPFN